MTISRNRLSCGLLVLCTYVALGWPFSSAAAPGAHGPNGEHLTTEPSNIGELMPRVETFSDQFELVAELLPDAMVIQLHHFQDNSPVRAATIEFETAEVSASAVYDEKLQQYRITSPELLTQLAKPQPHELVVTIMTEDQADLLVASFTPQSPAIPADHHDHDAIPIWFWTALLIVAAASFVVGRLSRRQAVGSKV
jgi:hypothetical protein